MSLIDIAIIIIIIVSLLSGLFRGFIREVLSLISWITALWIAYNYAVQGAAFLEPYLEPPLRFVAAFAVIFIVTLLLISMVSYLVHKLFSLTSITGIDRSLGTLFGIIRGVIVVALLILCAAFMDFTNQPCWKESILVNYFLPITEFIRSLIPDDIAKLISLGGRE